MKKHLYLPLIACLGSLVVIPTANAGLSTPKSRDNTSRLVAAQPSQDSLRQIAQSITVKVSAGDSRGSGILIAKAGKVYTVLTNAHVVNRGEPYRIQTPDGKIHQALLKNKGDSFRGNDLAVLEFQARGNYTIATLGDSSALTENREVFAAGFPFEQEQLTFTSGKITLLSPKPLVGGYQIGYTNETIQGMSGGPVLNRDGKLIGVVGMGNAILNDGYVYQDGSHPLESTLQQMRQASFAVPLATLAQVAPQFTEMLRDAGNGESVAKTPVYTGVVGSVDKIAQQITVRIDSRNNGNGSGAIVAKRGQTYYVLTAAHVVKNEDQYQIVTPDGQKYSVQQSAMTIPQKGVDIAVVQFTSNQTYQVATLANYDVRDVEGLVFVSGFPGKKNSEQRLLTGGNVFRKDRADQFKKDDFSFYEGRRLLYSNLSYPGMSGGPVLDKSGRVVGINAGAEGEYANNQKGEVVEFTVGFSLGVPISNFVSLATQAKMQPEWLKLEKSQPPADITKAEITSVQNQLFSLQVPSKNADAFAWLDYGNQLWRSKLGASSEQSKRQDAQAVAAFDKAIQLKPDFYQAYYAKGFLLVNASNKSQEALGALKQATKLNPQFAQAWFWQGRAFVNLRISSVLQGTGTAFVNLQRSSEALECYDKAIKLEPKNYVFYMERGGVLSDLGRYQDALAAYTEAININANFRTYSERSSFYRFVTHEYKKAIADYTKAMEFEPNDPWKYMMRASMYQELEDYPNMIADYSKAIEIKPDFPSFYSSRGRGYVSLKEYPKAIADFTKAIELEPDKASFYSSRGLAYNDFKDYQKAIADYNKSIELSPKSADSYGLRGLVYFSLKEYQKALADYTKSIEIAPRRSTYSLRGSAYADLKEYQKALADYNQAIAMHEKVNLDDYKRLSPRFQKAMAAENQSMAGDYIGRGQVYYDLKEYQKALADYNQGIVIDSKYEAAYNVRGLAYADLKEYQKALVDFNKAIDIDSKYATAYSNRGTVYSDLKEYQKALADYNKAIELEPDNATAYNNRGTVYRDLKEYQKALADYNKAIELLPDDATPYNNRGLAYANLKEYQKALADYTKAIELLPDNATAYSNRGSAYADLKEYQKALADYNKAIELLPDNATIYNNRGSAYADLKEYQKALADLNKAIEIQPDYANPYSQRGRVYGELKEYQKALADLNKAIELNPDYAKAYKNRANVYYALKDYQKARADMQKAAQVFYQEGNMSEYQLAQDFLRNLQSNK